MMTILEFLFGSGLWRLWYALSWLVVLCFVVLMLFAFGRELKRPGEKPATPSLGSCMVVLIACGLALVTLANGTLFTRVLAGRWYAEAAAVLGAAGLVLVAMTPVNVWLATSQSHVAFYANAAASAAIVLANLWMLWRLRTGPQESIPLSTVAALTLLALPAVLAPAVIKYSNRTPDAPHPWAQRRA